MQALILAAGMGKRLKGLTENNTKCMVKVNGVTLAERMLSQLDRKHLSRIVIVTGYEGQKLVDYISGLNISTPVVYVENTVYDRTNNIYSLYLARDYLGEEDTLLFESDIIFEDAVLGLLLDDPRETLALVDRYESWMDGTCVRIGEDDHIEAVVSKKYFNYDETGDYYKTVNIYKFSREFSRTLYIPFLKAYIEALGNNEYYEQVLRVIAMLDKPMIQAKRLDGQKWYEIDDIQDLDIASSMFAAEDEKASLMQRRYGGYWRYPKLLDFCYLVNPYFPPKKLEDELKSNFSSLLVQYPSGMEVVSLLASRNFGVDKECIVVGNGAAELIHVLMEKTEGRLGVIRPTFEEYPNRYNPEETVVFTPEAEDFSYTAGDIIKYFDGKGISSLVIINPDNPTGNYIRPDGIKELLEWSAGNKIKLIIDESFADFADEADNTLLKQELLERYPLLYVIKSISKSYGVPGLRLGIAASGDRDTIKGIKEDVSIWNINSFAECYLQVSEKYKTEYEEALVRFREERARMQKELTGIPGMCVFPSQANYFMAELKNGISSRELVNRLLRHDILIKDLSDKIGCGRQFIRVAVRKSEENSRLCMALRQEMVNYSAGRLD